MLVHQRAALPFGLLLLCACPSLSNMHTARPPLGGTTEISIQPLALGIVDERNRPLVVPSFEAQVRHSFTDMLELGVKLYPIGLQADLNIMFLDFEHFAMSIDPMISGIGFSEGGNTVFVGYFFAPILLDVVDFDFISVTVGPKPGFVLATANARGFGGSSGVAFLIGGTAGAKFKLGRVFRIMLEGSFIMNTAIKVPLWSAGVGFQFAFGGPK